MPPERIRLSRTKGWRLPAGAVVVARPSRWGNPYRIGQPHPDDGRSMTRAEAVALYAERAAPALDVDEVHAALGGRDLGCWCPLDGPCHGNVLLRIANAGPAPAVDVTGG